MCSNPVSMSEAYGKLGRGNTALWAHVVLEVLDEFLYFLLDSLNKHGLSDWFDVE